MRVWCVEGEERGEQHGLVVGGVEALEVLPDAQQHCHRLGRGALLVEEEGERGENGVTSATATGPTVKADWMKISASAGSDWAVKSRSLCISLAAGPSTALRATARRPWSSAGALGGGEPGGWSGAVLAK